MGPRQVGLVRLEPHFRGIDTRRREYPYVQIPMPMNPRVAARVLVANCGDVAVTDARVRAATVAYLAEPRGAKERVMTLTNAAPNMVENVCSILRGWETSFLRSAVRDVSDSTASRTPCHCV